MKGHRTTAGSYWMTTNEHGETDACAMLMVSSLFFLPYCGPFVPLLPTALDSHELLHVDLEMPLLLLFSFCCCWSVSITRRSVQKKTNSRYWCDRSFCSLPLHGSSTVMANMVSKIKFVKGIKIQSLM